MDATNAKKVKGKRRIALNLLDWIIIISILLAGVGIWLRYGFVEKWQNKKDLVTANISFTIADIKESTYTGGYFSEGSPVYNVDNNNSLIGYFAGEDMFSYVPAKFYEHKKNGEMVIVQSVTDRIEVNGVIVSEGIMKENGFFYGGTTYIAPGQYVIITSRELKVSVLITDIEIVESVEN